MHITYSRSTWASTQRLAGAAARLLWHALGVGRGNVIAVASVDDLVDGAHGGRSVRYFRMNLPGYSFTLPFDSYALARTSATRVTRGTDY